MTMKHDLAAQSSQIHWPEGFSPESADLFSHNELVIIDAEKWPLWYPNSKDVALLGGAEVLGGATIWRWNTFWLPIERKIHEYVTDTRLGWHGYPPGTRPSFCHAWLLMPQGDSCLVLTGEVGMGKDAVHLSDRITHDCRRFVIRYFIDQISVHRSWLTNISRNPAVLLVVAEMCRRGSRGSSSALPTSINNFSQFLTPPPSGGLPLDACAGQPSVRPLVLQADIASIDFT
jgi:hypothetical protein